MGRHAGDKCSDNKYIALHKLRKNRKMEISEYLLPHYCDSLKVGRPEKRETRNNEHISELKKALSDAGHHVVE